MPTFYAVAEPGGIATAAQILGGQSAAALALADFHARRSAGQMPVLIRAKARGQSSILVVDGRHPPEFLPRDLRSALVRAAEQLDGRQQPISVR